MSKLMIPSFLVCSYTTGLQPPSKDYDGRSIHIVNDVLNLD